VLVGVTMRSFEVARLEIPARDLFRAVLRAPPLPLRSGQALAAARAADPDVDTLDPPPPAPRMTVPVRVLQGTIREDTGGPLAAARVAAFEEHGGQPLGTITADRQGRFAFVLPPGRYRVVPLAPGMRPLRFQRVGQARVRVTMTLDASPDLVEIVVGAEVLTFRMDDSIWPEYVPPPSVKAFLRTRYCSDVNAMFNSVSMQPVHVGPPPLSPGRGNEGLGPQPIPLPLSVAVRRLNLPKYWWLKKLYTAPPNPATCKD